VWLEIELSAAGVTEGVLDVCDRFVEKITEEAKVIANLSNLQKEFEKDKQRNQNLSKYITTMRQLQREFISMQSRTDELFARLTQLVCASCKDKK
jgi:CII-binding regulator of phage lambda lysogenization HflD